MNANRLAWRCRRGMQELDILLAGYLRRDYPHASPHERRRFEGLLEESDETLWRYLTLTLPPEDPALADLIQQIRRSTAFDS
ncbi:MAG: hypothetical protein RL661_1449 [Pseudomonadota bacterium]